MAVVGRAGKSMVGLAVQIPTQEGAHRAAAARRARLRCSAFMLGHVNTPILCHSSLLPTCIFPTQNGAPVWYQASQRSWNQLSSPAHHTQLWRDAASPTTPGRIMGRQQYTTTAPRCPDNKHLLHLALIAWQHRPVRRSSQRANRAYLSYRQAHQKDTASLALAGPC